MNADFKCQKCGAAHKVGLKDTHTYQNSVPLPPAVGGSPARKGINDVREKDFITPMLIVAATGVFAYVTALSVLAEFWALAFGLVVSDITWVCVVLIFLAHRYELMMQLTYAAERALGEDIDGDNVVGEPVAPGRTIINSPGKRRPALWRGLSAAQQHIDRIDFAVRMYRRQAAKQGVGQDAMKSVVLPSGFRVGPSVHVWIMKDLVDCGAAVPFGRGFRLVEFSAVQDLVDYINEQITVGV